MSPTEEQARRFVSNTVINGALTKSQLHVLETEIEHALRAWAAREREACAKIAESLVEMAPHCETAPVGSPEQRWLIVETMFQCGLMTARKIREQSTATDNRN